MCFEMFLNIVCLNNFNVVELDINFQLIKQSSFFLLYYSEYVGEYFIIYAWCMGFFSYIV